MRYESKITSKGTITIASPIRKALGFKPGQTVYLSIDKNNQMVVDGGTSVEDFETLRDEIISKIPSHKKSLTGNALKEAAPKAWTADYRD